MATFRARADSTGGRLLSRGAGLSCPLASVPKLHQA